MHTHTSIIVALFITLLYSFSFAQTNYPNNSRLAPINLPENYHNPLLPSNPVKNGDSNDTDLHRNNRNIDQNQWQSEKRKIWEEIKAERRKRPYV